LAAIDLREAKYNHLRKGFGAGLRQMDSLSHLPQARTLLFNSSACEVLIADSGVHQTQLRLAVKERLRRLCAENLFFERPLYDSSGKVISESRTYTIPATGGHTYRDGCPPADMLDAQIYIGLDKAGSPSSVIVAVGSHNKEAPNRLGSTLAAMLKPHRAELQAILRRGDIGSGQLLAARIFLTGDNLGITRVMGHKGPNASLPCPSCSQTPNQGSSRRRFGIWVNARIVLHPPTAPLLSIAAIGGGIEDRRRTDKELGLSVHLYIERPALEIVDARTIVPSPVHLAIGIARRILRLGVEILIADRSPLAGLIFAASLAKDLCEEVGVHAVPYHCGNFMRRHCGTVARRRDIVFRGRH